ncbi:hypothetical protein RRG08_007705 [Elysia crispata]|uniref:Uncharacterized protein n=1 Tax=Elysia crispata TaxID=231223 RepID=A0AAE1D586_9GAST|nr:hypothetical protein RRG08_007705 [Elysia crispata]KAK3756929.1 hypothetical protein RRG08_007705 [Elysia crispata]
MTILFPLTQASFHDDSIPTVLTQASFLDDSIATDSANEVKEEDFCVTVNHWSLRRSSSQTFPLSIRPTLQRSCSLLGITSTTNHQPGITAKLTGHLEDVQNIFTTDQIDP